MKITQYCTVVLKDGRKASIVEIFGNDYLAEVGNDPTDWDTIFIKAEDIEEVILAGIEEK